MTGSIVQPSFAAGEIAPALYGRVDLAKYQVALKTCRNFTVSPQGGVSNRPGTEFIAEVADSARRSRLVPFQFSPTQTYVIEFGHNIVRFVTMGGLVLAGGGGIYSVAMPYGEPDLPTIKFTQSADVMTIVHPGYVPNELSRLAPNNWTLTAISFGQVITAPTGVTAVTGGTPATGTPAPATRDYDYVVTAISATTAEESVQSATASVTNQALSVTCWNTITWTAVSGASGYNVYKRGGGSFGLIGLADTNSFRDDNIKADVGITPPIVSNPFAGGNNPGAVGFFEQRRIFGASTAQPQTLWGSQNGNYRNFNISSPLKDDDAFERTLVGGAPGGRHQAQKVRHIVPMNVLIVLTSGAEWKVNGGSQSDIITPTSITTRPQSYSGSSEVPPLVVNTSLLFVQEKGSKVRDLRYDYASDAWGSVDVSLLARHLLEGRQIIEWAWSEEPGSLVWAITSDGALLSLTYVREQDVFAWARHDTDGFFESIASISEGNEDAVYVTVHRTINGVQKRYIERLHTRVFATDADAWFLDCARQYRGAPATVISGLGYLEGKTVGILADGAVVEPKVVVGGQITLEHAASVVTVGLPITAEIETLAIDVGAPTVMGKKKKVVSLNMRLERTRGLKAGPDADNLYEIKERTFEPYGSPPSLFTGDSKLTLDALWNTNGSVLIRQDQPLPATILAIVPEVEAGDR
jgi:hypothetical protein